MNSPIILAGYLSLLLVLSFILIKASNLAVSAVHALLTHSHASRFGLVAFFVALSQCLPEMLISIVASLNGHSQIAVAAVLGSNLANISLILGGAALVAGSLRAVDSFVKQEIAYVLLIGALPPLLLLDTRLSRLEAVILLIGYVLYQVNEIHRKPSAGSPKFATKLEIKRLLVTLRNHTVEKKIALFLVGSGLMLLASEGIVRVTESLAAFANVPVFLITLVLVSIGTSLPELVFDVIAIKRGEASMAFGSVLGSVVTDSTLTLGLSALILPIALSGGDLKAYLISILGFIAVFGLFWYFTASKHRLDRWEGAALMAAYLSFAVFQYVLK